MSGPVVSVLLPYRDAAATVDEAVGCLLAQRGVTLEVLAVDDGSTDDGPARVAEIARGDARVVRIATGGAGIVAALVYLADARPALQQVRGGR